MQNKEFDFSKMVCFLLNSTSNAMIREYRPYLDEFQLTYPQYLVMMTLWNEEEKAQIYAWLIEAREFALDAENSNKKHAAFGKYKGRINNYLAKRGYDLKKEREEWYKRVKARGGSL
jgi:hypothetical protein